MKHNTRGYVIGRGDGNSIQSFNSISSISCTTSTRNNNKSIVLSSTESITSYNTNTTNEKSNKKLPALKSVFSRSALAKKAAFNKYNKSDMLSLSSITVEDTSNVGDKYAICVSDDEDDIIENSNIKYESYDNTKSTLIPISEVNESNDNIAGPTKDEMNNNSPIKYESISNISKEQSKSMYNTNRNKNNYITSPANVSVTSDDYDYYEDDHDNPSMFSNESYYDNINDYYGTFHRNASFESIDNSTFASSIINTKEKNSCHKVKVLDNFVDLCGSRERHIIKNDVDDDILYTSEDNDSNSFDDESVMSAFGCHDLDFREEILDEILDVRLAFDELFDYIKVRLSNASENMHGKKAREEEDDNVNKKKSRKKGKKSKKKKKGKKKAKKIKESRTKKGKKCGKKASQSKEEEERIL